MFHLCMCHTISTKDCKMENIGRVSHLVKCEWKRVTYELKRSVIDLCLSYHALMPFMSYI